MKSVGLHVVRFLFCFILSGLIGCGAVIRTPLSISSFTANPGSIASGGSSSLTAVFPYGTGTITPGNMTVTSGTAIPVSPAATTTYTLTVSGTNSTAITATATVTVTGSLSAPTGLTATPSDQLVTLSWTSATGATGYQVKRSTTSGGPYTVIGTTTGTVFADSAVVNNTTYYYVVAATDTSATSANSAEASATPMALPAAASSLTATPGDSKATLSWSTATGAASYEIARSTTSGGPYTNVGTATTTGYIDTGLTNGTPYYYVIYSVNAVGTSAASNQAEAIPIAAPTGLTAVGSDSQVALYWNASAGATSYNIYVATTEGGTATLLGTSTTNRFVNTGLTNGVTLYYYVRALNSTGISDPSAWVAGTPNATTSTTMLITNPRVGLGTWFMNDWDTADAFVDLMKQSRTWNLSNWNAGSATVDSDGWPTEDASTVLQTFSTLRAMSSYEGTYKLVFTGKATVTGQWFSGSVTNMVYNSATNTSTADVTVTGYGSGYINLVFTKTQRTASSATGTGFTNAHLYRPGYATDGSAVFTTPFLKAMGKVSTVRMMDWTGTNSNYVVNWTDRTTPNTATQQGLANSWTGPDGTTYSGSGGVALEYQIMLCNTVVADCYFNIPVVASDDYVKNMALVIAYGSDGTNPYTSTQTNPVYPPLNPGLRAYLEYANEVWNSSAGVFPVVEDICNYLPSNHPLLTVDDTPDVGIWYRMWRYPAWRMATISQIFEGVFGSSQMMTRVRPLLETQQGDGQSTLDTALQWLDAWAKTQSPATTVSGLIYGGGGSAYYGVNDSSSAAVDSIFASGNYPSSSTLKAWAVDSTWLYNYGLKHVAYEGGPGINTAFTDAANRLINADSRMETMVNSYQTGWDQMGGDLLIYYDLAGSSAWEFTSDIQNIDTPKFAALADIQSGTKPSASLGTAMPGTLYASTESGYNIRSSGAYSYTSTIGGESCISPSGSSSDWFTAYPVHADTAFTGTLTISGAASSKTTMVIWINGVQQGTVTMAAESSSALENSTSLSVSIPAGLSVIRMETTSGGATFCSLTVTQ